MDGSTTIKPEMLTSTYNEASSDAKKVMSAAKLALPDPKMAKRTPHLKIKRVFAGFCHHSHSTTLNSTTFQPFSQLISYLSTPPTNHRISPPSFTGLRRQLPHKAIGPADAMLSVISSDGNGNGNGNGVVDGVSSTSLAESPRRSKSRFISKPSWLLLTISDMEDKIQAINGDNKPDTFGERADFYYRKRPELLALVQDLYKRYLYLADRYTRTLSKQPQEHAHAHVQQQTCDHYTTHSTNANTFELVISELVMRFVEYEIVVDELQTMDTVQQESNKKIALQKSLLEVLESERVVLTNENSRLASESLFMKRKAGELARCMLLERSEDQRVFVLSRKIDDLQGQIFELEKRNKEYYERLMKQQVEVSENEGKKSNISINIKRLLVKGGGGGGGGSSESVSWSGEDETGWSMSSTSNSSTCTSLAQVMKEKNKKSKSKKNKLHLPHGSEGGKKGYGWWWDRVKKFDMFMCGPHVDATC